MAAKNTTFMQKQQDEEYISERRLQKQKEWAAFKANEAVANITRILAPHRYDTHGDIYGANSIYSLYNDLGCNKTAWPKYKPSSVMAKRPNPVEDFYVPLYCRMREEYFTHIFAKHGYKTHAQLKDYPRFDISPLCNEPRLESGQPFDLPEELRKAVLSGGMDIFTPSVPEFVLKTSKPRLIYVKVLERDPESDIYKIRIEDYLSVRREICCASVMTMSFQYDRKQRSISWHADEYLPYEEIITADMDDMGWTEEQKAFWYDIFGVTHDMSGMVHVQTCIGFDENGEICCDTKNRHPVDYYLYNNTELEYLRKEMGRAYPELEINDLGHGQKVRRECWTNKLDHIYPVYMSMIAVMNAHFLAHGVDAIFPENGKSISIGNMTVRTKTPIRINMQKGAEK